MIDKKKEQWYKNHVLYHQLTLILVLTQTAYQQNTENEV